MINIQSNLEPLVPADAISRAFGALNAVPVLGLALLTVGVGLQFTWPIALIVAGSVMVVGTVLSGLPSGKGDA